MKKIILVTIGGLVGLAVLTVASIYAFLFYSSITLPPEHLVSPLPAKYGEAMLNKSPTYLIKDVAIIPMNQDTILAHQFVLIENGRITQITNDSDRITSASSPYLIEGRGKYLLPGLADMHVHLNDDNNLLLLVANGVTTVRDMFGFPFHLQLKEKIAQGELLGPILFTSSPVLEGPGAGWPQSVKIKNKAAARAAVIKYKKAGFDFIKIYHTLSPELYSHILKIADSINIPVVGHIPLEVELSKTLSLTQYSMEHINLGQMRKISPALSLEIKAEMMGKSNKWICPTLLVHKNLQKHWDDFSRQKHYEQYVDKGTKKFWKARLQEGESEYELQKKLATIMFTSGARFLSGTDCLNPYVLPGFSLHEELEELVNVGLSPYEALKTSTVNAAEFLQREKDYGTVEVGKMADLVLLTGNPLQNISNTKNIGGVMIKGRWLSAAELETILKDVKAAYANN